MLTDPGNTRIDFSLGTMNGNVGIGAGGLYSNANPTATNGIAYVTTGTSQVSNPSKVTGGVIVNAAKVNQAITDATNGNLAAAAEPPTQTIAGNVTTNTTINGTGGQNVINITGNVTLGGSNAIRLNGTASDVFIINVFGDFDLTGSGGIIASAPVTPEHVLVNFVGTNASSITADINNVINGTVLAPQRIILFHSVSGAIYGGNSGTPGITLSSGATLDYHPFTPVPEPTMLVGLAMSGLLLMRRGR